MTNRIMSTGNFPGSDERDLMRALNIIKNGRNGPVARRAFQSCLSAGLGLFLCHSFDSAVCRAQQPENEAPGAQVLTRGPVDEAFAEMVTFDRSEEHTSELQSRLHLVCRLLLEK